MDAWGVSTTWLQIGLLAFCLVCLLITTAVALAICYSWVTWYYQTKDTPCPYKGFTEILPPNVDMPSPGGTTKRGVGASYPHFWSHVGVDNYGAMNNLDRPLAKSSTADESGPVLDDGSPDKYVYARIRLYLVSLPTSLRQEVTLLGIETNKLYFTGKDVYLELRNCIDNTHQTTKAVGFNISLAKMRKRYDVSDTVILNTDHPVFETRTDKASLYADFAKLFDKRGHERRYLATGYTSMMMKSYSRETIDEAAESSGDSRFPDGTRVSELLLSFLHDSVEQLGRVKVSIAYLPTAEKMSVEIHECFLQQRITEKYNHISECYWKLSLMQKTKRHSRRRLVAQPFSHHMTWTDTVDTFDWIPRDSIASFTLVLSLVGIPFPPEVTSQSTDMTSSSTANEQAANIIGETAKTADAIDSSHVTTAISRTGQVSPRSPRGHVSHTEVALKTETIGELYIGSSVPDEKCAVHFQSILVQPRQVVTRWQEIY